MSSPVPSPSRGVDPEPDAVLRAKIAALEAERAKFDSERAKAESERSKIDSNHASELRRWFVRVVVSALTGALTILAYVKSVHEPVVDAENAKLEAVRVKAEADAALLDLEKKKLEQERDELATALAAADAKMQDYAARLEQSLKELAELKTATQTDSAKHAIESLRAEAAVTRAELARVNRHIVRPKRQECRFVSYRLLEGGDGTEMTRAKLTRDDPDSVQRFDRICQLHGESHRSGPYDVTCNCETAGPPASD